MWRAALPSTLIAFAQAITGAHSGSIDSKCASASSSCSTDRRTARRSAQAGGASHRKSSCPSYFCGSHSSAFSFRKLSAYIAVAFCTSRSTIDCVGWFLAKELRQQIANMGRYCRVASAPPCALTKANRRTSRLDGANDRNWRWCAGKLHPLTSFWRKYARPARGSLPSRATKGIYEHRCSRLAGGRRPGCAVELGALANWEELGAGQIVVA